jgi:hypothetical protein
MATKKPEKSEKVLVNPVAVRGSLFAILECIKGNAKEEWEGFFSPAQLKRMRRSSDPTYGEVMIRGLAEIYRELDGGRMSTNSMDMVEKYIKAFGVKVKK